MDTIKEHRKAKSEDNKILFNLSKGRYDLTYVSPFITSSQPCSSPSAPCGSSRRSCRIALGEGSELMAQPRPLNGNGTLRRRIRELLPRCSKSLMLRRIFEPPVCCLLPPLVLEDGNSREWPRRGRGGADAGAVDTDDSVAVKIEAGSGSGLVPRVTCSPTSEPLVCKWGSWSWSWDSDDGREVGVKAADGIAEVGSKETEERCDGCAGVDADVGSGSSGKDISSPGGKGGLSGRDMLASCMERACVSGAEARMEGNGLGTGSAADSDILSIE